MVLATAVPLSAHAAQSVEAVQVADSVELDVSRSVLSLTEIRDVTIEADFGRKVDLEQLELQFGGKSLDEWKQWNADAKSYSGEPFILVKKEPHYVDGTTKITAELEFGLPFGTTVLSRRSI